MIVIDINHQLYILLIYIFSLFFSESMLSLLYQSLAWIINNYLNKYQPLWFEMKLIVNM